jgi:hypothetical protein
MLHGLLITTLPLWRLYSWTISNGLFRIRHTIFSSGGQDTENNAHPSEVLLSLRMCDASWDVSNISSGT